jgi:hypothetical protein
LSVKGPLVLEHDKPVGGLTGVLAWVLALVGVTKEAHADNAANANLKVNVI